MQNREKLYAKIAGFYSTLQNNLQCFLSHFAEFIHMLLKSVNKIYLTVLKKVKCSRSIYGVHLRRFLGAVKDSTKKGLEIHRSS